VLANIAAAGVDPAVLLTHMHPVPSAGLSDPATGRRYFSNAELVVHENEPAHWLTTTPWPRRPSASGGFIPYKDRTRLVQKGEVFPGVTAIPCHGHTPGHTSFLISSGNEQLLIWGDTVHVPEIQTAREVCMEFDTPSSRRRVFDWWRPTGWRSPACTCTFPASLISCAAAFQKAGGRVPRA
jgi:glyoxylase-like metal-dependent hydrolase (beta-lactamase superfamily II)